MRARGDLRDVPRAQRRPLAKTHVDFEKAFDDRITPISVTIPPGDCDVVCHLANAKKVSGAGSFAMPWKNTSRLTPPLFARRSDLVQTLIRRPLIEADHMDCMVALAGERFYSATFRTN